MQRVLFTTAVGQIPDYFETIINWKFLRPTLPVPPFGIRFLKENIPEINVLEYPDWDSFEKAVRNGIDILGISFFMRNIPVVIKMIKFARNCGVKEIWGGGYGVLCDDVTHLFDRIFIGYAENEVFKILTGKEISLLKHPSLITTSRMVNPSLPFYKKRWGYVFTSRGCRMKCSICQTPCFTPEVSCIPTLSIEAVVKQYSKQVENIFIMDENFFIDYKYAMGAVDLLDKHNFKWGCMTRADFLKGRVAALCKKGFSFCIIGLESVRQQNLDFIEKKTKVDDILSTVKELRKNKVIIQGTYIIGFPQDTESSINEDINKLSYIDIQACQIFVCTPFPHTTLWDYIDSKYGIFENDYSKFNCMHLVYNHPNITPQRMQELLKWSYKTFYSKRGFITRGKEFLNHFLRY